MALPAAQTLYMPELGFIAALRGNISFFVWIYLAVCRASPLDGQRSRCCFVSWWKIQWKTFYRPPSPRERILCRWSLYSWEMQCRTICRMLFWNERNKKCSRSSEETDADMENIPLFYCQLYVLNWEWYLAKWWALRNCSDAAASVMHVQTWLGLWDHKEVLTCKRKKKT